MKKCSKCLVDKEINEFHKDNQKSDGRRPDCKICTKIDVSLRLKNPENLYKKREASRKYNQKNKAKKREYDNKWRKEKYKNNQEYREKVISISAAYKREKRKDKQYRMLDSVRRRPNLLLQNKTIKYSHTLGCDRETLIKHLEAQFKDGMSWANYGEWHVDHIYPISVAYKDGPESFKQACKYTNLQPLWAVDNIKKGSKVIF